MLLSGGSSEHAVLNAGLDVSTYFEYLPRISPGKQSAERKSEARNAGNKSDPSSNKHQGFPSLNPLK